MSLRRLEAGDLRSMLALTFSLRHSDADRFEHQLDAIVRRMCRLLPADSAQAILVQSTGDGSRGVLQVSHERNAAREVFRQHPRVVNRFMLTAGAPAAGHVFTGLGEPAWLTLHEAVHKASNVLHSLQVIPRSGWALGLVFRRRERRGFDRREWEIVDTFWRSQRIEYARSAMAV